MYLEHFGLSEAPFRITPHTDFFFEGANRGATLEALLYAITHDEGIVKVSGEVGSGKTMLCRVLIERLPKHVETIYLANPSLSRDEILFTIADELRVNLATNRVSAVLRSLQEHLIGLYGQGRQIVVLIDEAHAMPPETLEEIRLLSNLESNRHKLLQIVLFGQPEINASLSRPEMRQLKERITHNFNLEPLVRSDVGEYISFRMRAAGYKGPDVFAPAALRLIARASLGLTRRINILSDKALLAAFAGNTHQVTVAHVKAAVRDAEFRNPSLIPRFGAWAGAAAAAMLLAGAALAYFLNSGEPAPANHPASSAAPAAAGVAPLTPAAGNEGASPSPQPAGAVEQAPEKSPPQAPAAAPAPAVASTAPAAQPTRSEAAGQHATPTASKAGPAGTAKTKDASLGRLTRERLDETGQWLASAGNDRWFIQLLSADAARPDHVEGFVASATRLADDTPVRVYAVDINGTRRLGVIYGDYPSHAAASRALAKLPPALKTYGAYPRQVRRLRP
jgi:type II secretory pathway predicted ATPase ExeA/septal ring-binding cell division protein DamX